MSQTEALKKLDSFVAKNKNDSMLKPIVAYLKQRIEESESLAEDICQKTKTWNKCRAYIVTKAKEFLGGQNGAVQDETVYEWTEDYFRNKLKSDSEKDAPAAKATVKKVQEATVKEKAKPVKAVAKKPVEKPAEKPKKKDEMEGQMDIFAFLQ